MKEESASCEKTALNLDTLLVRDVGQFGRYQWRLLALTLLASIAVGVSNVEFIFSAARVNTRCLIPECEMADDTEFSPPWLPNAVPSSGGSLDGCQRYATGTHNVTDDITNSSCPASLFDPTDTLPCEQYVFEDTHTFIHDMNLACDEWRRSLIGSVRNLGLLVALSFTGFVSDHWGRRTALVVGAVSSACLGTARYWANSYIGFIISQFAETAVGGGRYSSGYILLLELIGPSYRVRAAAMANTAISVGHMIAALLAWLFPYWRHFTLAVYLPQFLFFFYFWIMPESIRWYLSQGKFNKAEEAIKKVAKVNRKIISEKTLLELKNIAEAQDKTECNRIDESWLIIQVFQHKPILIRCLASFVFWITSMFVYYGLSINAVNILGNRYLNYALVSAMEIPGFWLAVLLMDRVGRRPVIAGGFWLCALCQFGYIFISNDMVKVSLLIYLVGMSSISMVLTTIYLYTTELYPTRYRHRLFAFSSMMGRIGVILAPLTPALGTAVFESLPFMLFGGMALVAGLMLLLTPETRGTRLPDTMQQAAEIGREQAYANENTSRP